MKFLFLLCLEILAQSSDGFGSPNEFSPSLSFRLSIESGSDPAILETADLEPINHSPEFTSIPQQVAIRGQPYRYPITYTDADGDTNLELTVSEIPDWLVFDPVTETLSGTPSQDSEDGQWVYLRVSDGVSPSGLQLFQIWFVDSIRMHSSSQLEEKRTNLIHYIWGDQGLPSSLPDLVETNVVLPYYDALFNESGNLARIDRYTVSMPYGIQSYVYHLHPIRSNHRLFVYHSGHTPGGFVFEDIEANNGGAPPGFLIPSLLREGYSILAISMVLYDGNPLPVVSVPEIGQFTVITHEVLFWYLNNPFSFFLEPIVRSLNYVQQHYQYDHTYMTGLSGGGWTTTAYAAIDRRIERSFPVAGSIPNYLRIGFEGVGDEEQDHSGFYTIANYTELYVLGSYGAGRSQTQILNRYDACCFYGTRQTNWVDSVVQALQDLEGGGSYRFYLDETHTEHKISPFALSKILGSIPPDMNPIPHQDIPPEGGPHTVHLSGIRSPTVDPTDALVFDVITDNPALVVDPAIAYRDGNDWAELHFNSPTNSAGRATITVSLTSRKYNATGTWKFMVSVRPRLNARGNGLAKITLNDSGGQLKFVGRPSQAYLIQASTDFSVWMTIGQSTADQHGRLGFTDPAAVQFPFRFYRIWTADGQSF